MRCAWGNLAGSLTSVTPTDPNYSAAHTLPLLLLTITHQSAFLGLASDRMVTFSSISSSDSDPSSSSSATAPG